MSAFPTIKTARALVVNSLPLIAYGLVAVTVGLWVLSVFKPEWVG